METKVRMVNRVSGVALDVEANQAGDALVAQGAAEYEDITRGGLAFHCREGTAQAPIVAAPTTTVGFGIQNSAPDGGRSIIIDVLYAVNATAGATLGQFHLLYVLGQTRPAVGDILTHDLIIRKNNGLGAPTDSVAICEGGGAILDAVTGVAIGYTPIGPTVNASVVSLPGMCLWAEVNGRLIVSPGHVLGLTVFADTAAGTWHCGAMWHEKQITLA